MTAYLRMAALAALAFATPVSAQVRDTAAGRPMVRGGVYDKPFETRLFGRTALGGYAEAHARYQRTEGLRDEAGFEAKRLNIFTSTQVSDFVRLGTELEFEDGGREIKLEFAAIDVRIHPSLTLRGGMLLSPLGRFNLSHDSPLNEFTDRPLVSTELLGVALSEPGFGVFGQFGVTRTGRVAYELYATNGFHDGLITASEAGTRIPLGRGNFEDNNGAPSVVGRTSFSPKVGYEIGISAHHGPYNVFNDEGVEVDERRDLSIFVLDMEATVLGVQLMGEGAIARLEVPEGLVGIYAERQHGFYAEAVREFGRGWITTMPSSAFAAKLRFDYVDFDVETHGSSTGQLTAGFNFRPTRDSVLKFDFVRGHGRDEFNNRAEHAWFLASIATYF
jgi:hypothetical protein